MVGNLGSLAARLVFSKIEESAYFYFTQTVSREKDAKNLVCQIHVFYWCPYFMMAKVVAKIFTKLTDCYFLIS